MTRTLRLSLPPLLGVALLGALCAAPSAAAASGGSPPAGGAAIGQVIGASLAAALLTTALLVLGFGHRSGRVRVLTRIADEASRVSGLPGWAAVPLGLAAVSLIGAVFGMYWDISLHIDNGRDPGPLANPAHYFILAGLFGIFAAGWLAIVLPTERPSPTAVRIARDWHAPVGGVMLMACASFALAGFPLDDISHRLFGQDITLWGPTHLMLIGGAGLSLFGILALLVEASLAGRRGTGDPRLVPAALRRLVAVLRSRQVRVVSACGGLLLGLSVYQGEFDFGVAQFRLLYQPLLIAFAAGVALVTARILAGRGAALGAAVFFIAVRGGLALLVGPVLGETTPHLPLFLAEAMLVEAAALAVSPARPYRFGVLAGGLVGSLGVLAEWGWSHVWMPVSWPTHLVPQALAISLPVAIAGGVLGAFAGSALQLRADALGRRSLLAVAASMAVTLGAIAYLAHTTVPDGRVTVALTTVHTGSDRTARATVRFDPPSVARNTDWLQALAWQGGGKLVVEPLRRVGDGAYRADEALPLYGEWKSVIRLQRGTALASVPVFLPNDPAIPAAEVRAPARFTRVLTADHKILQRERKSDVPSWLWGAAYVVVFSLALALLVLLGWGLTRLGRSSQPPPPAPAAAAAASTARPAAGVA